MGWGGGTILYKEASVGLWVREHCLETHYSGLSLVAQHKWGPWCLDPRLH